ncbi:DUF58 domain-containing protein [Paraconexibacter sp.]|uniref:DUF58 domain-containing protein n=1 Tax=Paraconexibacter sp. TaxID=2949640 RepID=UPI00356554E4
MSRAQNAAGSTSRPAIGTFALGAALLLVAAALDAEPLYVPGVAFTLLALVTSSWVLLGARGITVQRRVGETRVLEDAPLQIVEEVTAGRMPLPTGVLEDPLLGSPAPLATGHRRTRVRIAVRFSRRGRRRLEAPRVVVRDPFGLISRVVRGGQSHEVLVLPRIEPVHVVVGGGDGLGLGLARRRQPTLAEVELEGLGPLRPGTPASRIHWPSIARLAEPQERRLHADGDRLPLVLLDPRVEDGPSGARDLDAAVRATASLAVHLARAGGCLLVLPGDRRPTLIGPTLSGWPRLHARLALVGGTEPPALGAVAARLGPLVYVSARRIAAAPRTLRHAPGGGRVLVVPDRLRAVRPVFTVAGCAGHELTASRVARTGAA